MRSVGLCIDCTLGTSSIIIGNPSLFSFPSALYLCIPIYSCCAHKFTGLLLGICMWLVVKAFKEAETPELR